MIIPGHFYFTFFFFYSVLGIGNAFGVLSDDDKRRKYDQFGEDLAPTHTERRYRQREFEGIYKLFMFRLSLSQI